MKTESRRREGEVHCSGGRYIAKMERYRKALDVAKASENLLQAHTWLRGRFVKCLARYPKAR